MCSLLAESGPAETLIQPCDDEEADHNTEPPEGARSLLGGLTKLRMLGMVYRLQLGEVYMLLRNGTKTKNVFDVCRSQRKHVMLFVLSNPPMRCSSVMIR